MLYTLFINWDVSPDMFTIPGINWPVRWYGLLFAAAFLGSQFIMSKIYKKELRPQSELDVLTLLVIAGTVIGARLGHCFFYDWDAYKNNLLDIFKVWEGGLASHGGAIGIILAMILYCRKTKENWLWIFDRIVIVAALSAVFIRLGNLMNSEILGKVTDKPWAFVFVRNSEDILNYPTPIPPRHPAQLYEALFSLALFILMFWLWKNKRDKFQQGFMFGLFCTLMFTERFFVEMIKENQVAFEDKMAINMGQWLSIPFVVIGIGFMIWSKKRNVFHEIRTSQSTTNTITGK